MKDITPKIEQPESSKGHKQKIIDAIKTKDVEQLKDALIKLNNDLIGINGSFSKRLEEQLDSFFQEADEFGEALLIIYLGGPGTTRIVLDIQGKNIDVKLTRNSPAEIRKKWEQIQ